MARKSPFRVAKKRTGGAQHASSPNLAALYVDLSKAHQAIRHLTGAVVELELMVEFTMRYFRLERKVNGGLVDASGQGRVEVTTLRQLFARDREKFAEALMEEARRENTAAQHAAPGNGHSQDDPASATAARSSSPGPDTPAPDPFDQRPALPEC